MPKAAGHALHRRRKHGASGDPEMVMVASGELPAGLKSTGDCAFDGSSTDASDEQPSKAQSPVLLRPAGSSTDATMTISGSPLAPCLRRRCRAWPAALGIL